MVDNKPVRVERMTASEAYAGLLFGAVAADGTITHAEALELTHALSRTAMFRGLSPGQMRAVLARVSSLYKSNGLDGLLASGAAGVPPDLRETAFANCADLVMSDDKLEPAEEAYLKRAQRALGITDAAAARILEVVGVLNKG